MGGREGQTHQPQLPEPESQSEGTSGRQKKGPSGQLRRGKPAGGVERRGRAGPGHQAALTSALSDGLSTAIFCHGSASCASGIFPPGPPPSPPPPSPPAPRPARLSRRPSPTAAAAAAAVAAAPLARARRRHRPSNTARSAGDARAPSESLALLPGTGSRPFLPLLLPPRGLQLRPPPPVPAPAPSRIAAAARSPTSAHNMAPKRYLSLRARLSRRRHRARTRGAGLAKTRPRPPGLAPPSFLAPASASGPRLLSGRASPRDLGALARGEAGGGGGRRGEKAGGAKGWEPLTTLGPSRSEAPWGCREQWSLCSCGGRWERRRGHSLVPKIRGTGMHVSIWPLSSVGAYGHTESMGTSPSGQDPPSPESQAGHSPGPPCLLPPRGRLKASCLGAPLGVRLSV